MEEVAVGRVELDAVEARPDRVASRADELSNDVGDFVSPDRARHVMGPRAVRSDHFARRLYGAGGDRLGSGLVVGMGDATHVHELGDDGAACFVNRIRYDPPTDDLVLGVEPGHGEVALPDLARRGALGDQQAGAGALGVVRGVQGRRRVAVARAVAGQRGHDERLGHVPAADPDRFEGK